VRVFCIYGMNFYEEYGDFGDEKTVSELSMGWVDPWVGLGWVHCSKSIRIFERIVLVHLKHG